MYGSGRRKEENIFIVDGTTLSLTRGDCAYLYVGASLGTGDSLEFRVYDADNNLLFSREQLPDGTFLIANADTDSLDYGTYTYEIVLINGGTETVEQTGDLIVTEEVH